MDFSLSRPVRKIKAAIKTTRRFAHERRKLSDVHGSLELISGNSDIKIADDEAIVLTLARDSAFYITSFVRHYRELGAQHIIILDNGSTDETVEIAGAHPDVTVLRSTLPFGEYKQFFRRYLVRRFARERWAIAVDVDELFDYPHSEQLPLHALLAYLDRHQYTAVLAHMLDMVHAPDDILGTTLVQDDTRAIDLKAQFPYYDLTSLQREDYPAAAERTGFGNGNRLPPTTELAVFSGGVRQKLFGLNLLLAKHPLIKLTDNVKPFPNSHGVHNAHLADITGVLYHYKLVPGLAEKAAQAATEGQYYHGSAEYRQYLEVLSSESSPIPLPGAKRLGAVNDLLDQRFISISVAFNQWLANCAAGVQLPERTNG